MDEQRYRLIAVKRGWIPEWLYALIVRSVLRPLCVHRPLVWILHRPVRPGDAPAAWPFLCPPVPGEKE